MELMDLFVTTVVNVQNRRSRNLLVSVNIHGSDQTVKNVRRFVQISIVIILLD